MSNTPDKDPPRWSDDPSAGDELRSLLSSARNETPPPEVLARIAGSITGPPSGSGGGAVPASSRAATTAAVSGRISLKFLGASAVFLTAGYLFSPTRTHATHPPVETAVPQRPAPSTAPIVTNSNHPAQIPAETPRSAPHEMEPMVPPTAPRNARVAPPRAHVAEAPTTPLAECVEDSHFDRVRTAQRALADGNARTALQLIREDEQQCQQRGSFTEERERVAIHALLRDGQRSRALARWQHFQQSYPSSPHALALRSLFLDAPDGGS